MRNLETTPATPAARIVFTPAHIVRRSVAILGGALVVGVAAQFAVPLPGTPVPVTLQVPAVLLVAGLLGPRAGAASMVVYLALGIAGLPVFAPVGPPGFSRLLGPTGGYLLAYPVAAALTGQMAGNARSWPRLSAALLAGLAAIHLGGTAQLAVLTGDPFNALRVGSLPFLLIDLVKLLVVALLLRRFTTTFRARL
ncbi:MAG: biotin transporter BioY [Gemmatimonadetes bacterium]|nr:biotin transporter BioY [Gemmatimonadota bacterium]